jgi:putative FmdB family regulatory protein
MPIYVYRCADCNAEIEKRQSFSDAPLTTCESCGGHVRRVLQPAGVIFKGSGFYSTDNRNGAKGKKPGADGGESGGSTSADGDTGPKKDKADTGAKSEKSEKSDGAATKSEGGEKKSQPATSGTKTD